MLEERLFEAHKAVQLVAFRWYLRKGFVPPYVTEVLEATRSLEAFEKANPNWPTQPRVPVGQPNGGQWTDGGGSAVETEVTPNIRPVYPEEFILELLPQGRVANAFRRFIESGRRGADWIVGRSKRKRKWANQFQNRDWTPQEITEIIKTGKRYPAPNDVNKGNEAVRYQDPKTGRFVVRDEVTKEILQISGSNFKPRTIE